MTAFQSRNFIIRRAGKIKPTGRLRIDYSHPLAKTLVMYVCEQNGRAVNLLRPQDVAQMVPGSTAWPTRYPHATGVGLRFDGSSSIFFQTPTEVQFNGGKTFGASYINLVDTGDFMSIWERTADNNGSPNFKNWGFRAEPGNFGNGITFGVLSGGADPNGPLIETTVQITGPEYNHENLIIASVVAGPGGSIQLYENAVSLANIAVEDVCASYDINANIIISGQEDSIVDSPLNGVFNYGFIAHREWPWTQEDIRDFVEAPYAIVKTYPRILYFNSLTSTVKNVDTFSDEFGFESGSPTLVQSFPVQTNEMGFEAGSPSIVMRVTAAVTPAEFGTEMTSVGFAGFGIQVSQTDFGWEAGTVDLFSPSFITVTHAEFGVEITTGQFTNFVAAITPEQRIFNVYRTSRIVLIDPIQDIGQRVIVRPKQVIAIDLSPWSDDFSDDFG